MKRKALYSIVKETNDFLVVDKAAGTLSVPGRSNETPDVITLLRDSYDDVFPVHRIDQFTSGILIVARTPEYQRHLSTQFAEREVIKLYNAIVAGTPAIDEGKLEFPIKTNRQGRSRIDVEGKYSLTWFRVEESFSGYSYLTLKPDTGRTHQIRVHLAAWGHPLVVDPIYGSPKPFTIADIKPRYRGKHSDSGPASLLDRTPLHCHSVTFRDTDDQERTFSTEVPKDMRATLNQLRKWRG